MKFSVPVFLLFALGGALSAKPNYTYHVKIDDPAQLNFQEKGETRFLENAKGFYSVLEPNGALRTVTYTADEEGFKPVVSYTYGHATAPVKVLAPAVQVQKVAPVVQVQKVAPVVQVQKVVPLAPRVEKVVQVSPVVAPAPVQVAKVAAVAVPTVGSGGGYSYPKPSGGGYSYPAPSGGGYSYPAPSGGYLPPRAVPVATPVVEKVQYAPAYVAPAPAVVKPAVAVAQAPVYQYQKVVAPAPVYQQYAVQAPAPVYQQYAVQAPAPVYQQYAVQAPAPVYAQVAAKAPPAVVSQYQHRVASQVQYYQPAAAKVAVAPQYQYVPAPPPRYVAQPAPAPVVQNYVVRQPQVVYQERIAQAPAPAFVPYAPQHVSYAPAPVVQRVEYAQPQVVLAQKQVTFGESRPVVQIGGAGKQLFAAPPALAVAPAPVRVVGKAVGNGLKISGNAFAVPAASGAKNPLTFVYSYGDGTSSVSHSYSGSGW